MSSHLINWLRLKSNGKRLHMGQRSGEGNLTMETEIGIMQSQGTLGLTRR